LGDVPAHFFKHPILPEKFWPPTPLLDLQALPFSALHNKEFEEIFSSTIQTFNKIQMQVFQALYTWDENAFIGAPTWSSGAICTEFPLLRLWSKREQLRAVCVRATPKPASSMAHSTVTRALALWAHT